LRIVHGERVELQRLLPADAERAIGLAAHTAPDHAVEGLTAAAAIGIRSLLSLRLGAVRVEGSAGVDQLARQRIEAGIGSRHEGEVVDDGFGHPDADLGLLEAAFRDGRLRAREISRRRKGLIFEAA